MHPDETTERWVTTVGIVAAVASVYWAFFTTDATLSGHSPPPLGTLSARFASHNVAPSKPSVAGGEAYSFRVPTLRPMTGNLDRILQRHGRDWRNAYREIIAQRKAANLPEEQQYQSISDSNMKKDDLGVIEYKGFRNLKYRSRRDVKAIDRVHAVPGLLASHWCDRLLKHLPRDEARLDQPAPPQPSGPLTAEQLIRARVQRWVPSTDEEFINIPTLLCVTTVHQPSRFRRALQQYKLWGQYCSHMLIMVVQPPEPAPRFHLRDHEDDMKRFGVPLDNVVVVIEPIGLSVGKDGEADGDEDEAQSRSVRWQALREAIMYLGQWRMTRFFEYALFVRDDVYVIPENLYYLVSQPEIALLHQYNAPLYMGQVLTLPDREQREAVKLFDADGKPLPDIEEPLKTSDIHDPRAFVSASAILLNSVAVSFGELFMNREVPACFPLFASSAEDIALGKCFAHAGIVARDATDVHGHDLFHVLPPQWLAKMAVAPPANGWWYKAYRPKPMPSSFAWDAVGMHSVAFSNIATEEDMETLASWIS